VEQPTAPTVQRLFDVEQIKQLKARYFRIRNTKVLDLFADLFAEECQHILPSDPPKPPQGNAEHLAGTPSAISDDVTVHYVHMPEIRLLGHNKA